MNTLEYNKYEEAGAIHHKWYRKNIPWYKVIVDAILDFVDEDNQRVIDLGCGDGLVCKLLSEKGHKVVGVDNNFKGLELARELAPKASYIFDNLNTFTPSNFYDYMICLNTIEHLTQPENIVKIFKDRVLKKGIIITDKKQDKIGRLHYKEYDIYELKGLFKYIRKREIKIDTEKYEFIALEVRKK